MVDLLPRVLPAKDAVLRSRKAHRRVIVRTRFWPRKGWRLATARPSMGSKAPISPNPGATRFPDPVAIRTNGRRAWRMMALYLTKSRRYKEKWVEFRHLPRPT